VLLICAMECRHIRISCFGMSGSRSMEYQEVEADAALVILGKKT
jgi:predicted nucleotidyltransferase